MTCGRRIAGTSVSRRAGGGSAIARSEATHCVMLNRSGQILRTLTRQTFDPALKWA